MSFVAQYDFDTAKTEMVARFGNRTDLASRAGEWLNSAQQRLARSIIDMPELDDIHAEWPITEDVAEYDTRTTYPSLNNVVGIYSIRHNGSGYRLRRFPWHEYRSLVNQGSASPTRWTRRGYHLAFDPKPSATDTVKIDFRRRPQMDVLETPSEWHEDLIKLAVAIGWGAMAEHDRAKEVLAEVPALLLQAFQMPLSQEQWEAYYDDDLSFIPASWERR